MKALTWIISFLVVSALALSRPWCAYGRGGVHSVSGRVVDASTSRPLPFANVIIGNGSRVATSDAEGEFRLKLVPGDSILTVRYVGYADEEVWAAAPDTSIVVRLVPVGVRAGEVSVVAEQTTARMESSYRLEGKQIKEFAGITRDPLRALQMLPGVSSDNESTAKVSVRGGTWSEGTVLIDGVEIQSPFHLQESDLTSVGMVNVDLLKNLDFSSGGWDARYGDALSSVTSMSLREGDTSGIAAVASLGALDLSASIQGPFGRKGSFIAAARKSYVGDAMRMLGVNESLYAGYYDAEGVLGWHFNELNKIKVDFLYSRDNAARSPSSTYTMTNNMGEINGAATLISTYTNLLQTYRGNSSNLLLSLISSNIVSNRLTSRSIISLNQVTSLDSPLDLFSITTRYEEFPQFWSARLTRGEMGSRLDMRTLNVLESINYTGSKLLDLYAGAGITHTRFYYLPNFIQSTILRTNTISYPDTTTSVTFEAIGTYETDTTSLNTPALTWSAYVLDRIVPANNLLLDIGGRVDYFSLDMETAFSPRASARYESPSAGLVLNAAWGIYYEPPRYDQVRLSGQSPDNTKFQRAEHVVIGVGKEFGRDIRVNLQLYRKRYSDLLPTLRLNYGSLYFGGKQNDATGFAEGVDLQCTAAIRHLSISMNYSYLVAREKVVGSKTGYYPRISDQRHSASLKITYSLYGNWAIGMDGFYGSGYAYTPYEASHSPATKTYVWVQGAPNSAHLPAYARIDLNIRKTLYISRNPLRVSLTVTNLLNRQNVWAYDYTYDGYGNLSMRMLPLLGIVPAIGISYSFSL